MILDLLLNTMRSVETLLHHFNRNRTLKVSHVNVY